MKPASAAAAVLGGLALVWLVARRPGWSAAGEQWIAKPMPGTTGSQWLPQQGKP